MKGIVSSGTAVAFMRRERCMFENIFSPSPLVWSGLVAGAIGLPILIHLINRMRHKRIRWAAMDFLMQSYKRQRNWIWLKQLLLLLSRIAMLLFALFMLGNVGCDNDGFSRLIGGKTTHHYIVLDDSFSMSDRNGAEVVFDRAREAIRNLKSKISKLPNQRLTLMRTSQMLKMSSFDLDQGELGSVPLDFNGEQVDSELGKNLEQRLNEWTASQFSATADNALMATAELIKLRPDEQSNLYLISDFRSKDWDNAPGVQRTLEEIATSKTKIQLVGCAKQVRQNLSVDSIQPVRRIRAAGVPMLMEVSFKNWAASKASRIQAEVSITTLSESKSGQEIDDDQFAGNTQKLPTIFIDEINAGETVTRRFPVYFPVSGQHVVSVTLPDDAIRTDNNRKIVVDTKDFARALIIDDGDQLGSFLLSTALAPGQKNTGVSCDVRTVDFLRDIKPVALKKYQTVFLLDVPTLTDSTISALETFVNSGGGLCIFSGPNLNINFYNEKLYRGGKGLMPLSLQRSLTLPERNTETPDVVIGDHPIFSPFAGNDSPLLDLVTIKAILRPPVEWKKNRPESVRVAAWVRNVYPLVVEKDFGAGRVACVTTTATGLWHNWIQNPTFVIFMLELHDYLVDSRQLNSEFTLGSPVEFQIDESDLSNNATLMLPKSSDVRNSYKVELSNLNSSGGASPSQKTFSLLPVDEAGKPQLNQPGIVDLIIQPANSPAKTMRYAVGVESSEGDLAISSRQSIIQQFENSGLEFLLWEEMTTRSEEGSQSDLTKLFFFLMIGILIAEPILAYLLSYHPRRRGTLT